jgi:uncharacterized protein
MAKTYHLRRGDKEIKDKSKLIKILKETTYVTLALSRGDEPYVAALSHSYDEAGNCLYFHCAAEGKKLDFMRSNPVVSGIAVIDHGYYAEQCNHLYVSAVFKGRVEFVEDVEEKKKVLAHMIHAQEKKKPGDLLKRLEGPQVAENLAKTAVGRIVIEELTGKKSAEVNF